MSGVCLTNVLAFGGAGLSRMLLGAGLTRMSAMYLPAASAYLNQSSRQLPPSMTTFVASCVTYSRLGRIPMPILPPNERMEREVRAFIHSTYYGDGPSESAEPDTSATVLVDDPLAEPVDVPTAVLLDEPLKDVPFSWVMYSGARIVPNKLRPGRAANVAQGLCNNTLYQHSALMFNDRPSLGAMAAAHDNAAS